MRKQKYIIFFLFPILVILVWSLFSFTINDFKEAIGIESEEKKITVENNVKEKNDNSEADTVTEEKTYDEMQEAAADILCMYAAMDSGRDLSDLNACVERLLTLRSEFDRLINIKTDADEILRYVSSLLTETEFISRYDGIDDRLYFVYKPSGKNKTVSVSDNQNIEKEKNTSGNKNLDFDIGNITDIDIPLNADISNIALVSVDGGTADPDFERLSGYHIGMDLQAASGTAVTPLFNGVVEKVYTDRNYGLTVIISHYNGLYSKYSCLQGVSVKAGDTVKQGETVIGVTGSSGSVSLAPHLHMELVYENKSIDPLQFMGGDGAILYDEYMSKTKKDIYPKETNTLSDGYYSESEKKILDSTIESAVSENITEISIHTGNDGTWAGNIIIKDKPTEPATPEPEIPVPVETEGWSANDNIPPPETETYIEGTEINEE